MGLVFEKRAMSAEGAGSSPITAAPSRDSAKPPADHVAIGQ